MSVLLDANVLISLLSPSHIHHAAARNWFRSSTSKIATCPITEGALVRLSVRETGAAAPAAALLAELSKNPRHEFWADDIAMTEVAFDGVIGHRQVTDAYLAQLARSRGGKLATFDQGLASLHQDVAFSVALDEPG